MTNLFSKKKALAHTKRDCQKSLNHIHVWVKRVKDYRDFVKNSPGPGMLKNRKEYRVLDPGLNKDGNAISEVSDIIGGADIQMNLLQNLEKSVNKWEKIQKGSRL